METKFEKGQTVYIRVKHQGSSVKESIVEGRVEKVGRRWVSVSISPFTTFFRFDLLDNLREDTDYTPDRFLHSSKEEIWDLWNACHAEEQVREQFNRVLRYTYSTEEVISRADTTKRLATALGIQLKDFTGYYNLPK